MFSSVKSRSSRLPNYTAEDVGVKVDRPAVEEFTEIIGA
ncbi:unnamed protein product [Brassica oleracea var. botrytis]